MTVTRRIIHRLSALSLVLTFAGIAILVQPAAAQYMYLDSNGDGVHDANDRMNKSTPTPFDVWLDTDSNRNGSPGTCEVGSGALDMSHYEFVLQCVGGAITWGSFTNQIPSFGFSLVRDSRDTTGTAFYHNGYGGLTPQPPGLYKVASMIATVAAGSPAVEIIVKHPINRTSRTSFGSECEANAEHDHMKRFGKNWLDADGLAAPIDARPVVTAPGMVLPQDGTPITINVTASDPDGDPINTLTANLSALPPGHNAVFTANGSHTAGTLTWTPTSSDSGNYNVTFAATNFLSGTKTTVIHVIGTVTDAPESQAGPDRFELAQNRPNPFNPVTSIQFRTASPGHVRLEIFDMAGRFRARLVDEVLPAGRHTARWLGLDALGRPVSSGVYWYRLESHGLTRARRMILLR